MKTKFLILFLFANSILLNSPLFSENLKIDMRLNTKEADEKNYMNFSYETTTSSTTTKTKIKDKYDAVSGASKNHSTKKTLAVYQNQSKKKILPKTLRAFLLFPVCDFSKIEEDNLQIEKDAENLEKITVTFSHRGNSYKIESDEGGNVFVNFQKKKNGEIKNSFRIKFKETEKNGGEKEKAENNEKKEEAKTPKQEDSKQTDKDSAQNENPDEKTQELDSTNKGEDESDGFENDGFDDAAEKVYAGKLKLKEKNGILTLKGKVKLVEKPKIEEVKKEKTEEKEEQPEGNPTESENENKEGKPDKKGDGAEKEPPPGKSQSE